MTEWSYDRVIAPYCMARFYDRVIIIYDKSGKEVRTVQEEVREIYKFFWVEVLYVKGNTPTDKF